MALGATDTEGIDNPMLVQALIDDAATQLTDAFERVFGSEESESVEEVRAYELVQGTRRVTSTRTDSNGDTVTTSRIVDAVIRNDLLRSWASPINVLLPVSGHCDFTAG